MTREFEFWTVEPLLKGETVFCLASGPSLTEATVEKLRGRRVVVVNSTAKLVPWADVLFFTDSGWYEQNRQMVAEWPSLVVSLSRTAKRELPDKIRRVKGEWTLGFPPIGSPIVRQGRSSGHTVLSVLVAMGVKRIVLVGYDMRLVNGREHHHADYAGTTRDLDIYAREFVPGFSGWNAAAVAAGVEIINCTPESALTEFPFAELDQVLDCNQ